MRNALSILALFCLPLASAGVTHAQATAPSTSGATANLPAQAAGTALEATVEQAWIADTTIPSYLLAAKMRGGSLQLFGAVETAAQRDRAVATARKLAGATPVADHIEITKIASLSPPPKGTTDPGGAPAVGSPPPQDAAAALGASVEDAWIADGKIPYELLAAKVRGGTLQLFGAVETPEQHASALAIARKLAGATPVKDTIVVKKIASLAP